MTTQWTWRYEGWDPAGERLRESLCTLGNGYFATRGAAAEASADAVHYPGTYAAGVYNRLTSHVAGRQVDNEDMVNLPNWLPLRVRARGGPWFAPGGCEVLDLVQELDLRVGVLSRRLRLRDADGREVRLEETRLVHMGDPHLAVQRLRITPLGWGGVLEVEAAVDGTVRNAGVERYRALNGRHLVDVRTGVHDGDTLHLSCRTSTSGIHVAVAARTRLAGAEHERRSDLSDEGVAGQLIAAEVAADATLTVEKTVAVHTSRDLPPADPLGAALERVALAGDADALSAAHADAWGRLWRRADLHVSGEAGGVLRLHLFHLLQTLSPHTASLDAGVPARGLHGEAYRGHVFWDELFVLPFLDLHLPEVSRGLLMYRYRRLEAACRAAAAAGRRGAMYPWQSGGDGHEETQRLHLNPLSGRWLPDHTRLQHHVGSAVAYNVWQYWLATGDTGFMNGPGAEMFAQIARFWAYRAHWDGGAGRYRILGVVGPDEYHDAYPDADRPGLDDNAYTNVTAAWVLARAADVIGRLPAPRREELCAALGLDAEELARWEDVSRRLRVPFHAGVISQFDGYGELAELDWDGYRARYGDIRRLDRILESEGDSANRYQASKQADVLMLGYLFPPAELAALFRRLGYRLDDAVWSATVGHYMARTSHGSTLSGLVHGWVLARARHTGAWAHVREALLGDVADLQGGTTGEGIHLGAMAGTLDLVQRGVAGLQPGPDALRLDPVPLPGLDRLAARVRYRDHWGIGVAVDASRLTISVPQDDPAGLPVQVYGSPRRIAPGARTGVDLPAAGPSPSAGLRPGAAGSAPEGRRADRP